jgi:phage portal protein BeeE
MVQGYDLAGWRFTGAPMMSPIASQVLLPGEVIHSRAPNPYLYWRGLSPLVVAMLPAAADYAAEQFMKGLMLNNADTGLIVTMKDQPTDEQHAHVLAALRERKRMAGTADRPLFLWGGARVEKPAVSSADMQFLENRKLNRQEIAAIFKVPESMMGFTESRGQLGGGGGSSIEADKLTFVQNTLTNHCRRLEAALDPVVKSFGPDLYGWFDIEGLPILQDARRQRLDAAVKAFGMGVPFNELNHVFDLGFKALPWGDKGHLPATLQEAGQLPAAAELAGTAPERGFGEALCRLTHFLQHHTTDPTDPSDPTDSSSLL